MKLKGEIGRKSKYQDGKGEEALSGERGVVHTEAHSPPVTSAGWGRTSDQRSGGTVV